MPDLQKSCWIAQNRSPMRIHYVFTLPAPTLVAWMISREDFTMEPIWQRSPTSIETTSRNTRNSGEDAVCGNSPGVMAEDSANYEQKLEAEQATSPDTDELAKEHVYFPAMPAFANS